MSILLPLFKASSAHCAPAGFAAASASRVWRIGLAILAVTSFANAANVVPLQNTIVDNNALNFSSTAATFNRNINGRTYQRFPMATLKGYQYATYYDANRNVCVGRRKLPDGAWQVIRFTDYEISSSDSHNVVSMGICAKDGTIHLAFDHHGGSLHYRVSVLGAASNPEMVAWSTNLFGPVTAQLGAVGTISSVTYPSFFNAPNGNLMLYYRNGGSGSGDGMIQEYNGTTHNWTTGLGKFIARTGTYNGVLSTNSTSRNPYINGISYGGTRLHVSWGWRESAGGSEYNHDLCYAYSDDNGRTWRNSAGTQIGTTGSSFITLNSTGLVVAAIPENEGLSNQYTHHAYADGSCHVMVAHNGSYQHYWRNAAGTWSQGTLGFSGSRPKLTGDDDGNLFLVYVSGSRPRIAKGVPNAGKTAWTWSLVHTQSDTTEAGEGQLDYSRWETDRVLSFYGQETPPSTNEVASPLHVLDYQVSSRAILPRPLDAATGVELNTNLQWTAGLNATAHRVYWGTNLAAVTAATTSSTEYQGQQTANVFQPPPLIEGRTYFWRIDEVQSGGAISPGAVWQFATVSNAPPTPSAIPDQTILANTNTGPLAFIVGDDSTPPGSIMLNKLSSNTGLVPLVNIVFGGSGSNRTVTVTPAPDQSGSAIISVIASDGSLSATNTFALTVLPPGTIISTLFSDLADSGPRQVDGSGPSILASTATDATLYAGRGGTGSTVDRCVVFPIQLPALGMKTNPFTAASFAFHLISNDFAPTNCNLDLYGLASRSAATVLATDYYSETDVPDPTPGTLRLQDNLCTPATVAGLFTNSPAGGSALVNYLNAQYAGGTNAGKWVFLRLSKDATVGTSAKKYTVRAANGAATNNAGLPDFAVWPRIQFTAVAASPTNPAVVMPSLSNGMTSLAISGDPAFYYTVQASTNLADWINLLVTNSPALPFHWTDTNAASFTNRFYRVLIGP